MDELDTKAALPQNHNDLPRSTDSPDTATAALRHLQAENERLQAFAAQSIFERDVTAINHAFPDAKVKQISTLGDSFCQLRAAGVDPLTAFAATQQNPAPPKTPPPPTMGALGTSPTREKDFYTPAQVDRLSEQELEDPSVWARARRSMTKWK